MLYFIHTVGKLIFLAHAHVSRPVVYHRDLEHVNKHRPLVYRDLEYVNKHRPLVFRDLALANVYRPLVYRDLELS